MAFWGADVEQLRQLSSQLTQEADEIAVVLSNLVNQLGNTDWNGLDSEAFRHDWSSTHASALRQIANDLRDAAALTQRSANQQEVASDY